MRGYETSPQVFLAFFLFFSFSFIFYLFAFPPLPPALPGRSALYTYQTLKVSGAGAKPGLSSRHLEVQEAKQFEEVYAIFFFLEKNIFLKKPASPRQAAADFFFFLPFSYFRSRGFAFSFSFSFSFCN